ncbi:MAG TPA: O-antigen ligase family protein [Bryobacteraceae bacterium]|nr:O-antigen ligase family protein [Bryobacteraceae bacterium]
MSTLPYLPATSACGYQIPPRAVPRADRLSLLLLGGYMFFLPMQIASSVVNFAPSDIFLVLWVIAEAGQFRIRPKIWSGWHTALVAMFWMGTCISLFDRGNFSTFIVAKLLGTAAMLLAYFALASSVDTWDAMRFLLRIFIAATVLHCLLALCAYFARINESWLNYGGIRVSGMLLDPNAFGGIVVAALLLHGITFGSGRPLIRGWSGIFCGLVLALALLLTFSRSAWISCGFGLIALALFRPRLVGIFVLTAALAVGSAFLMLGDRSSSAFKLADRPRTTEQRLIQFSDALPLFVQSPVVGLGLGGFDDAERNNPTVDHPYYIHNTSLWILTEFGLIGAGIFLGLLVWVVRAGVSILRGLANPEAALVVGLICVHAAMFGLSTGIEAFYQRHWWMAMGLIAAARAICLERREAPATPARRAASAF